MEQVTISIGCNAAPGALTGRARHRDAQSSAPPIAATSSVRMGDRRNATATYAALTRAPVPNDRIWRAECTGAIDLARERVEEIG